MDLKESPTDLEAFRSYVNDKLGGTLNGHSMDEAVAEFLEYQRQIDALKQKVAEAERSAESHGTRPMTEVVVRERRQRLDALLADEGVSD